MLMKIMFLLLTLMIPFFALHAFSGAVDHRRGGHNCWSNCEQYGLYPGEYHAEPGAEKYHEGW